MLNRLLLVLDLLLLVTAGALGLHLYRAWIGESPAAATPPSAAPTSPELPAAPPRTPSPAALGVIAERNLFSPTRAEITAEPPRPVTATPTPPPRPVEKPRLYGVVVGENAGSRAYLWDPQTKKVLGYKVGDAVGESRLERIGGDRVVLRRSGEAYEVLLRDPAKPKPAPPPPVAVPGAPPTVPAQPPGAGPFLTPPLAAPGHAAPEGTPPGATPPVSGPPGAPGVATPVFPPPRPGTPNFPIRPPVRTPRGQPSGPTAPTPPPSSEEGGS